MDLTDDKSTMVQVMVGAVRQQPITWANVDPDLCRYMVSLGHNELMSQILQHDINFDTYMCRCKNMLKRLKEKNRMHELVQQNNTKW